MSLMMNFFFGEDHKSNGSANSDKGPKINDKVDKN